MTTVRALRLIILRGRPERDPCRETATNSATTPKEGAPMAADELQTALDGLPSERIQRLVDRLEQHPRAEVSAFARGRRGPLTLAGYERRTDALETPETDFALAWDRLAGPEPVGQRRRSRLSWRFSAAPTARRSDVQLLMRAANAVLAKRIAQDDAHTISSNESSPASSGIASEDEPGPARDG
jgi:hypothetical protein